MKQPFPSIAAIAVATALGATGLLTQSAPSFAGDELPRGSSGGVHYDHYRDRGYEHHGWRHHDRRPDRWRHGAWKRDGDRHYRGNRDILSDESPRPFSTGGSYSGGVSSYRDPGNGSYIYIERNRYRAPEGENRPVRAPGPKVLRPQGGSSACSDESGVCVIRPAR